ncbi:hypothetical protein PHJA_000043200 [Phtheirospermum japonicum]|uniref:Uncharacterized protein n=1 Tax=Phtheirospermum japonicum TaxID=374723 RepID=A0A830AXD7_9LAMI|nr:hypothetical protein PHJA_000043200 [Phtheirospermum japonicum]
MARHIVMILSKHQPLSIARTGFGTCTFLLCAFALFMCASHSRRWRRWKSCYGYGNHEPFIQLNQEEITGYQFGDVDPSTCSGDGSLWKKNILIGGKCQLPDFSGVIIYDSKGNAVAPAKSKPALPIPWR